MAQVGEHPARPGSYTQTALVSAHDALRARAHLVAYALIAVLPVLLLAPWFNIPLNRDEGAYIVVARGMNHGMVPYADLFDHKPPLIYGVYWAIDSAGAGIGGFRAVAALVSGLTALLAAATSRKLGLDRRAAMVGGLLYALAASNVALQSNANTEVFMTLPLLASLWAILKAEEAQSAGWLATAGALVALATLFKTPAVFLAAPLLGYGLVRFPARLRMASAFMGGFAAVMIACVAVFAGLGAVGDFWYANVTYNRLYSDSTPALTRIDLAWQFRRDVLLGGLPFWIIALAGCVVAARRRQHRDLLLLGWSFVSFASLKFTGRDSAHYYVQLLPGAALLGAVAFASIARHRATLGIAAVALAPLFAIHTGVYAGMAMSGDAKAAYAGTIDCEAASPGLGAWVRDHTSPDSRIYNLGRDTELYYYAGRDPAVRFMYDRPFYLDAATGDETARALSDSRPAMIVDTTATCPPRGLAIPPAITAVIASNYTLTAIVEDARIYTLRDPG